MSRRLRRLGASAAVLLTCVAAAAPAEAATASCPSTIVFGARGSGEPQTGEFKGMGSTVHAVYDALRRSLPNTDGYAPGMPGDNPALDSDVGYRAVQYPAAVITANPLNYQFDYSASVNAGVTALRADLLAKRTQCPSSTFAVVGYSQGADVVRRAVVGVTPGPKDRIVVLGDPNYQQHDRVTLAGRGNPYFAVGALIANDYTYLPKSQPFAAGWQALTICHQGDGMCQWAIGGGLEPEHTNYVVDAFPAAWKLMGTRNDKPAAGRLAPTARFERVCSMNWGTANYARVVITNPVPQSGAGATRTFSARITSSTGALQRVETNTLAPGQSKIWRIWMPTADSLYVHVSIPEEIALPTTTYGTHRLEDRILMTSYPAPAC